MCSRFDCPKGSLAVAGDDNTRDHNETPVGLHIRQAELPLSPAQSSPFVYAREGCHPYCTVNTFF